MMPAGKYYIGDLCYVMHDEWVEFCEITIDDRQCNDGEFTLKDGRRFATYGTMYGDGCYQGLSVDAGLIGCILVSDIRFTGNDDNDTTGGMIVDFDKPFSTREYQGVIHFGHIQIDTSCEDSDDEPDVDEAQEWHDFDPEC
jgi:hypothetical protein